MSSSEEPNGSLGDPWLDRLPGVVAGAFFRRRIEQHFTEGLGGKVHTYSQAQGLRLHLMEAPSEKACPSDCREDGGGSTPAKPRGCVVFLHGGGFLGGAPSQFYPYAKEVRDRFGLAAACCEVSCVLTHPWSRVPFDTVEDARRCVRFLHDKAADFGIDRQQIVLVGASSGGHTAAMAALGAQKDKAGLGLAGLVLFNPVLDLCFGSRWSERSLSTWVGFFALRACYGTAALVANSPLHQVCPLPCPTLIMHGDQDHMVPLDEVEQFQSQMKTVGNQCNLVTFPGEGHFFFNWRVSPANFARCVKLLGDFIRSLPSGT